MGRGNLIFGPLGGGAQINRSALRWLRPDGAWCEAGEFAAFCNIAVHGNPPPFPEEGFDLQVAFALPVAGHLRRVGGDIGGMIARLPGTRWLVDEPWAVLESTIGPVSMQPDLVFLAGRRMTNIAEDRSGLLTGWHDRVRVWWGDGPALLGAGACDVAALLRGASGHFAELYALAGKRLGHVALCQDEPLVPSAAVLVEQFGRTPAEIEAIREDMVRAFADGPHRPHAADWLFVGALLNALERSPLSECPPMVGRSGLGMASPPAFLCLSLTAELPQVGRHRRLGYSLNSHNFRLAATGAASRHWLRQSFEPVVRSIDDVARDLEALHRLMPGTRILMMNALSSPLFETVANYRALDDGTMGALASVRAKALNLMLHDLERAGTLEILDADAIAAELGVFAHMPDGVHASEAYYDALRQALVDRLQPTVNSASH
jgi:hypothetical protein